MALHLQREIVKLKTVILRLSAIVEAMVGDSVKAMEDRDEELAKKVIRTDHEIDHKEVDVEEECLKILALHQPVASDLRYIISVLKIDNDLERIGDLAVNIAERALYLVEHPAPEIEFDFYGMAQKVQGMLQKSLDAMVNMNTDLAQEVFLDDDKIDALHERMYDIIEEGVKKYPDHVLSLISLLSITRHLERIADHTTNIAEDVIYMIEGNIVRHRPNP